MPIFIKDEWHVVLLNDTISGLQLFFERVHINDRDITIISLDNYSINEIKKELLPNIPKDKPVILISKENEEDITKIIFKTKEILQIKNVKYLQTPFTLFEIVELYRAPYITLKKS